VGCASGLWLNRPDSVVPASLDSDHAGLEVDVRPAEARSSPAEGVVCVKLMPLEIAAFWDVARFMQPTPTPARFRDAP
jgi:hypothetical protein